MVVRTILKIVAVRKRKEKPKAVGERAQTIKLEILAAGSIAYEELTSSCC